MGDSTYIYIILIIKAYTSSTLLFINTSYRLIVVAAEKERGERGKLGNSTASFSLKLHWLHFIVYPYLIQATRSASEATCSSRG